jgi:hypothetical protein
MEDHIKKVNISGINNRYQMKKIINERTQESKQKKRIPSAKWDLHEDIYNFTKQVQIISDISNNNYDKSLENSLYAMVFLGIGEIFGSIFNGAIIDKFGGNFPVLINIVFINI